MNINRVSKKEFLTLRKAQVIPDDGVADGGTPYTDEEMNAMDKPTIAVPVDTLQGWAVYLSQGDNSPRWEIEKLLESNGHPIRSGL